MLENIHDYNTCHDVISNPSRDELEGSMITCSKTMAPDYFAP